MGTAGGNGTLSAASAASRRWLGWRGGVRAGLAALAMALSCGVVAGGSTGDAGFRFVVYGGTRGDAAVHAALVTQMVASRPDFVLFTGGAVASGRRASEWTAFDEATKPLRALCPMHGVAGRREDGPQFQHRLGPPKGASGKGSYYSFDHKGAHFVVLDSHLPTSHTDEQTRWLAADLAAAGGTRTFVLFHNPIYSCKARGSHGLGRTYWHPLLVKHRVRAVFSGNHHLYLRTRQDGVTYIITACGGSPLDRVDSRRGLLPDDVAAAVHHFLEVAVAPGGVRVRVVDPEGRTRDEFDVPVAAVPKPGGR